jgi:hypothetical protein
MIIDVNPEFGYEISCSIPYAYWLHKKGELEKVVTCKGMSPFYFFCDNVEEKYDFRSLDNNTNGVQNLPNGWIHHNAEANFGKGYGELTDEEKIEANGWLDYRQWDSPSYKDMYCDLSLDLPEKYIVLSNRYNLEHGDHPLCFFDIECLYNMFNHLTEKGYSVIYKRPNNTEFVTDSNEWKNADITGDVEGIGVITDYDLVKYYDNVYLIDDVISDIGRGYNVSQLNIFSRADGFISMSGGNSVFSSCFEVPVIIYVNVSFDVREGYFDENSYFRKLSGAPIYPIIDLKTDIKKRGYREYKELYQRITEVF